MTFRLKAIFQRDDQYEGVRRINIYLLRLVFILMFFVLGKDTWTRILTHQGLWEPGDAVVWCVWAAPSRPWRVHQRKAPSWRYHSVSKKDL
jgi:hypothetical protein